MKLGEKIKLIRTEKQLTQPELADKAGIEQSYLSKLENDKGSPSFEVINKIAVALDRTGMSLIDSLSQTYVEKHLSHIPEVAAEYAAVKKKREASLKRRFIIAAITVVLGVGVFFLGEKSVLAPNSFYYYSSDGIIKADETVMQFDTRKIEELGESREETMERLRSNKSRFNRLFLKSEVHRGDHFIGPVNGGRRLYKLDGIKPNEAITNKVTSIIGIMLVISGLFILLFSVRFKSE